MMGRKVDTLLAATDMPYNQFNYNPLKCNSLCCSGSFRTAVFTRAFGFIHQKIHKYGENL